jgi:hypothetical protein
MAVTSSAVTGNVLWAVYQFIVFIVLLSVLRARMVNTYHRIFRCLPRAGNHRDNVGESLETLSTVESHSWVFF